MPPAPGPALGSMRGTLTSQLTFPEGFLGTQMALCYYLNLPCVVALAGGREAGTGPDPLPATQECAQSHV